MVNIRSNKNSLLASSVWLASAAVLSVVVLTNVPSAQGAIHQLPRFWPGLAVVLMAVGGLAVLGDQLAKYKAQRRKTTGSAQTESSSLGEDQEVRQPWCHVLIVGFIVIYIVSLGYIGFVVATSVLFFAVAMAMRARHPLRVIAVSITVGVATAYLFGELLSVALPRGVGFLEELSRFIY